MSAALLAGVIEKNVDVWGFVLLATAPRLQNWIYERVQEEMRFRNRIPPFNVFIGLRIQKVSHSRAVGQFWVEKQIISVS